MHRSLVKEISTPVLGINDNVGWRMKDVLQVANSLFGYKFLVSRIHPVPHDL